MMIFMVLPLVALAYIGWHAWVMLPLPALCKGALIASGLGIWGGKFRIGTQSEYVVATITSNQ